MAEFSTCGRFVRSLGTYQAEEGAYGGADPRHIIPAGSGRLGWRSGIVIERPQAIDGAVRGVDPIDKIPACHRGLD